MTQSNIVSEVDGIYIFSGRLIIQKKKKKISDFLSTIDTSRTGMGSFVDVRSRDS